MNEDVTQSEGKIQVKSIKKLPLVDDYGQSLTVLPKSEQKPLKIFEITLSAKLKSSVSKAKLSFAMSKAELGDIDPSSITLLRFSEGEWKELETAYDKKENSYVFTSATPGFSVFVVTTKNRIYQDVASPAPEPEKSPDSGSSAITSRVISGSESQTLAYLAVLIVVILGVFLVIRRKLR